MLNREYQRWSRLDNAAKIFPSTIERADTRVFRFSCELFEMIDGELLQQGVLTACEAFPHYLMVMRRGLFWYYLEQTSLRPEVTEETERPCAAVYHKDRRTLLFRVFYYRRRISLEIYHALSDGTGALEFLKTIVTQYLLLAHPDDLSGAELTLSAAPTSGKDTDSFQKYYQKAKAVKEEKAPRAYHLRGEYREDGDLQILEGMASVKATLDAAHRFGTTLTVFLTAILIEAIHQEMYLRDEKYPVVISVPVNLRNYFASESSRNFFGIITVTYSFGKAPGDLADIIRTVDLTFKKELCKERLAMRMNTLARLEHMPLVQIIPLPLKNVVLRRARHISDWSETAVLSNVAKITLPDQLTPYVKSFHIFASTLKTQLCICSFGDWLQMGFSSAFEGAELQRNFFRLLTKEGIEVLISANEMTTDKKEDRLNANKRLPKNREGETPCDTADAATSP